MKAIRDFIGSLPQGARRCIFAVGALWLLANALVVSLEVRLPTTDTFLFKEAGVNLATQGRFIASNLPHMPPDEDFVFAYYPPVYPFCYGLWSKAFGVGIKPSILFDSFLKLLRTALLLLLIWPVFKTKRSGLAVAILAVVSFLSTESDRPDELAMVWGFAAWFFLARRPGSKIAPGLFLGLTGATSPAAGVFFGLGFLFSFLAKKNSGRDLLRLGVLAAATFALCNLPVHLADPAAFTRFSKQIPLSTVPYRIPFWRGNTWADFVRSMSEPAQLLRDIGFPYLFCLAGLAAIATFLPRGKTSDEKIWFRSSLIYLPLCLLVWSLQPFYLWFSCLGLLGVALSRIPEDGRKRVVALGAIVIALSPLALRETKSWAHAWERDESVESIRAKLVREIPAGKRVAITADQYFTLKNVRAIANIGYVCDHLDAYDYVYVTPISNSSRARVDPLPIPCPEKSHCFTLARDFTTRKIFTVFGRETPYYVRDSGGALYQNTVCPPASIAKNHP